MVTSLKEALLKLEALCTAHKQVNSYYHINEIIEGYKSNEILHTTVLSRSTSAVFNPTDITVTLQIACVDKTLKGDENAFEIESNTLQVLGDIINYININESWRYAGLVGAPSAIKMVDRTLDVVDGWMATVQIKLMKDNGICDVPISGVVSTPSCLPVTVTDSDGITETEVASGGVYACTLATSDIFLKFHWDAGNDTTDTATIDSDSAGIYTSIADDGASGTVTVSVNGGGFVAFSTLNPLTLVATDTIAFFRTTTTGAGWAKLTGTY
jgi:hypothetical protein